MNSQVSQVKNVGIIYLTDLNALKIVAGNFGEYYMHFIGHVIKP